MSKRDKVVLNGKIFLIIKKSSYLTKIAIYDKNNTYVIEGRSSLIKGIFYIFRLFFQEVLKKESDSFCENSNFLLTSFKNLKISRDLFCFFITCKISKKRRIEIWMDAFYVEKMSSKILEFLKLLDKKIEEGEFL
jgi:hypothetical protein